MATVCMINLPAHGHINPTLALVAELQRRGERIIYYASQEFQTKIEATGALFRDYGPEYSLESRPTNGPFGLMARQAQISEAILPHLVAALQADQPDYLLIDSMCLWGNLAQQVLKLPAVASFSSFASNSKIFSALRRIKGPRPEISGLLKTLPLLGIYLRTQRRIDQRWGTKSPSPVGFFGNTQALNLVYTSRMFQPLAEIFDPRFTFTGPSIAERNDQHDFPLDQLGTQPLIYISLGTIFNDVLPFYQACFAAFGTTRYQVVMSVGQQIDLQRLGPPPANFIVRRSVPQLDILQRTCLFITHGGMNSASEGLWYGVPLIVVPQVGDQFIVAHRVTELGAGLSVATAESTPERLRYLAEQVLGEPAFQAQAQTLGDSLRAAGGYQCAADEIFTFKQTLGSRVGI